MRSISKRDRNALLSQKGFDRSWCICCRLDVLLSRSQALLLGLCFTANLVIPSLSSAQGQSPLLLEEVLQSVQTFSPQIEATRQDIRSADAELLSSQGAFDITWKTDGFSRPAGYYDSRRFSTTVEQPLQLWGSRVFGQYAVSDGSFPDYEGKSETNEDGELRAGVEVPILRDGPTDRRRTSIARAEQGRSVASANVYQRQIEIRRAATNAYLDWISAGLKKRVASDLLRVATERTKQLSHRSRMGDLPAFDVTDNQRAEFQRKAQLAQADRAFQQAGFELSLYLRDAHGNPVIAQENRLLKQLPAPNKNSSPQWKHALNTALENRPELKRLEAQKVQNELEARLQENQVQPRLDVQLATSQDFGSGSTTRRPAEVELGLKLEIPLQTRVADGRREAALAKLSELRVLEQLTRDRIANDVKDALVAIDRAQERSALAAEEVKAAEELEKGELVRFQMGDSNLIFVNLREQTAAEARTRQIEALADFHKAIAALEAALASNPNSGEQRP